MLSLSKSLRIASVAAVLAMFAGASAGAATAAQQQPRRTGVHHRLMAQTHAKKKLHHRGTARAQARNLHKDRTMRPEKSLKTSENRGQIAGKGQRPSTQQKSPAGAGTVK